MSAARSAASRPKEPGGSRAGSRGYFARVWRVVRRIPAGRVSSYGAIARAAGSPGTARQVAWALRGAPASAQLPWHRVLGAGGRILLTGSAALEQRLRLEAEGVSFAGTRVRMDRHEYKIRS
jgi:methylated-DNA-protein-cysteine methyltransferase-like protein